MQPVLLPLAALAAAAVGHFLLDVRLLSTGSGPGWALVAMGIGLAAWAAGLQLHLGTHPEVHRPTTALATTGAYRFTRNPIYVGLLLLQAGASLVSGMWLGLLLLPVAGWGLHRIVVREEAQLDAAFGEAYERYRQRTRRWL